MDDDLPGVSDAFQAFLHEAPAHAGAWMEAVQRLGRGQRPGREDRGARLPRRARRGAPHERRALSRRATPGRSARAATR